jgi:ribosomal protein S18 acetylase RimI-like enzyme
MSSNDPEAVSVQFSDPCIRLVKESDANAIAELFRLNYGEEYAFPEVFDGGWVKKCVYNDDIICLVLEEDGEVVGSGALVLDVGNYDDQVGELGRFVVNPACQGRGQGHRIINGLFEATEDNVEFALGEARTAHLHSQRMMEKAGFPVIGFLPHYFLLCGIAENCILYGKLYGNGLSLRTHLSPALIPAITPLATHVLEGMGLNADFDVAKDASPYPVSDSFSLQEVNRLYLARLARIKEGRLVEPLLFGKLSLDEGHSFARRRKAIYLMALDKSGDPVGAIGFQYDETNKIVIGVELIAATEDLRGQLCGSLLKVSDQLGARIIEVNISAYEPHLQATFYELGFKPAAYAPAMVFHGTERLDVVKMLRLNERFDSGQMLLTESASAVFSMVENSLREFSDNSSSTDEDRKLTTELISSLITNQTRFSCQNVRYVKESDVPEIIELFEMTYGGDYISPDVYSGKSIKRCVHNRDMVGLVYVENNRVAASVALQFDYGRSSDQVGKISGFVVFPRFNRDWVAHSLLKSVFEAAEENLEYVLGDLIVDSRFVQDQVEVAGFSPLAYLPRYWEVGLLNRGVLPYGKLLGNGYAVRSQMIPNLIPEVAELARFILGDMRLSTKVEVETDCASYQTDASYDLRPLDRLALARLAQIKEGRLTEPLIFGSVSLEQGYSMLRRKHAVYLMALDAAQRPMGAIGFQHDKTINVVKATELIGKEEGLRGRLCEEFLQYSTKLGARVVEADVSAYDPRLQKTFFELGFRPVGYFPAKVFRGTERLDVVKMMKLNAPYFKPGEIMLTEKAKRVFTLVEKGF